MEIGLLSFRAFPKGPKDTWRADQGLGTWTTPPEPPSLGGGKARQPPPHTAHPPTLQTLPLPELFTCLSPGLPQSAQPRC